MPRNLFKVMAGISASKPNPLIVSTVRSGLTDAGNCNYWLEDSPYFLYNNTEGRWECATKQLINPAMAPNPNCPSIDNGWSFGYRPANCTITMQYKGGLSSCTVNFSLVGEAPRYTPDYLVLNDTLSFNADETKVINYELDWTNPETAEENSYIVGFYPSINENDPSPMLWVTQIDFSY